MTELTPAKPFPFEPFRMRSKYRFIEGYQGNDTVRDWREFDSTYHSVFACMRGSAGYPKGPADETVPEVLLLRPARHLSGRGLFRTVREAAGLHVDTWRPALFRSALRTARPG